MKDLRFECGTLALLGAGLFVASCGPEQKAPESAAVESPASEADEAAIKGVHLRETRAIKGKDVAHFLALFDSDAVLMPPDGPPIVGKAALRSWFLRLTDRHSIDLDFSVDEIKVTAEWAFERFSFRQTVTPAGGGEPITVRGKGNHVFRRQSDGSWKIARDIWNVEAPDAGDRSTRARGAGAGRRAGRSSGSSRDELIGRLRAELAELRRQLRDRDAQGPGDPSQAELIKRLQAQLAEQKNQIEQLQAYSCPECPAAIQRKGVIYLWDGRPPEPVEIPIEWVRR